MKWMLAFICLVTITGANGQATFRNPLLPSGADPWVTYKDGYYYYTHTLGDRIDLWKTKRLGELKNVTPVTIWTPPASGPNSKSIWAPELHFLDNKWYVYYTATDAANDSDTSRYIFVLENAAVNPFQGKWVDKGRVNTNYPGLDGSVFEHQGKRYFVYSAYVGSQSVLSIAAMINPWTIDSQQPILAKPDVYWEKFGGREILEGPQFLAGKKGKIFLVYSASACWADEYALGMLTANASADVLNAASWKKSTEPVFKQSPRNNVYASGHNAFFTSPDGKESWIIYHANTGKGQGCDKRRSPRMQKFGWKKDGSPFFGEPIKIKMVLPAPASE